MGIGGSSFVFDTAIGLNIFGYMYVVYGCGGVGYGGF